MNAQEFETQLRADGFSEIVTQDYTPRPLKGEHGHPFAVRGLVLSGTFELSRGGSRKIYRAGEVYAVAENEPHDDAIGADGARILYGCKPART